MFRGAITALVTPFKNGAIDEEAYRALIEWQIEQGIDGLLPCGTTGESATMSHEEHEEAVRICIEQVKGRVPVMAGAGSNNTAEAIRLTAFAKQAGADAALLISPYYNKPTQEGLFRHFKAINDDFTALPTFSVGGKGVISVTSNVLPAKVAAMCAAWERGDTAEARRLHIELMPVNRAMFLESNPIPVKTALRLMGRMGGEFRLPLCPMGEQNLARLKEVMSADGLL